MATSPRAAATTRCSPQATSTARSTSTAASSARSASRTSPDVASSRRRQQDCLATHLACTARGQAPRRSSPADGSRCHGGGRMRVWQPGSSLVDARQQKVDDWSWAATKRRITALYRLARPYRRRALIAIGALLAATGASLVPPILIGAAVDTVTSKRHGNLGLIVVAFVAISIVGVACSYAQTFYTGWVGERMLADLRNHLFR